MAKEHRALVTAPFRGPGLDRLEELADVVIDPWIDDTTMRILGPDDLAARIADEGFDIIICEADSCKEAVLEQPLVAIGSTRGDPTNVDVPGATAAGIPVLHAPGRNADAVAEITVGLLFACTRMIPAADRDVHNGDIYKDGTIPYQRFRGSEIRGRTAGVIGYGAIGREVAWRLEGLGMNVIAHDPFVDEATHSLDDLLAEADVISLHMKVTDDTRNMIDDAAFARMKDGAVFLNSARAELHDMDALTAAVESGKVSAAGLDHFPSEYMAPDHPLCAFPNVVLTPHIGGATYDTEGNHSTILADDLARLLAGERPRFIANPEVLK